MNSQLQKIYLEKWNVISEKLKIILEDESKEYKPTNPLLLFIDEEKLKNADIKVMIFGQETNDWDGDFKNDMSISLDNYDEFLNLNNPFSYGGQFWNGFNRFLTLLSEKYPSKKIEAIWNNVIKIGNSGRDKNYPPEYIYNIEKEYFNVIKDEINILKPDIILFMSGPNYDIELENSLGNVNFKRLVENFTERQIAKLEYENLENIYRTYHPNYLWRNNIDSYFSEIISDLNI